MLVMPGLQAMSVMLGLRMMLVGKGLQALLVVPGLQAMPHVLQSQRPPSRTTQPAHAADAAVRRECRGHFGICTRSDVVPISRWRRG
jgi:hypothetical protein